MTIALELAGLCKSYGKVRVVSGVSLAVSQGSMTGLIGPNGAGKTTTIAMTVGLLRPDSGTARVLGVDLWADPVSAKRLLGVLPDNLALPERLSGAELLTYWGALRGMDSHVVRRRVPELLEVLELDRAERDGILVQDFSTGMRKKIGLALAVLHRPSVLVLDEPFEAVDPVSGRIIRAILQRFTAGGGSVVISSHMMPLVEDLCDEVAILARGKLAAAGSVAAVRGEASLEDAFVRLVGDRVLEGNELAWFDG